VLFALAEKVVGKVDLFACRVADKGARSVSP
jgi:hypothetical protein